MPTRHGLRTRWQRGAATCRYVSYSLDPSTGTIELLRYRNGNKTLLQTVNTDPSAWGDAGDAPLLVELLRRGSFYLLYVNGSHRTHQPAAYVERPSSDVHCTGPNPHTVDPGPEPGAGFAGYKDVSGGVFTLNSMHLQEYHWEAAPNPTKPVATHCSTCGVGCDPTSNKTDGCWAFNQIIPGAILRDAKGSHLAGGVATGGVVLYVAGQDYDGTDGGGRARIGVATGVGLDKLAVRSDFILEGTPGGSAPVACLCAGPLRPLKMHATFAGLRVACCFVVCVCVCHVLCAVLCCARACVRVFSV